MGVSQHIVLFVLGILGITNALDFYVVAPSTLRLNIEEVIGIAFDSRTDSSINIEIQDYPEKRNTILQQNFTGKSGEPQIVKINLQIEKFPPGFLTASRSQKYVSLNVTVNNMHNEIIIPITSQYGYMFIQSDKPIYTPDEKATFKIIPLNEDGLPSTEQFQFEIRNPEGVVVTEKSYGGRRRLSTYFATHIFTFPKYPQFGEWKAVARYGNNLEENSTLVFELQEYVLPTFTVDITTPDIILPAAEEIDISLDAKHSYGKKINGVFTMRFGIMKDHTSQITYFSSLRKAQPINDGFGHVQLNTQELKNHILVGWFPRIEGSTFVVEATVVDDDTGNKVVEIDSKGRFTKIPYLISRKRCLSDFKPGLPSVFEADITHIDGRPADGVQTRLTAVADNRQNLRILNSSSVSDAFGKVSFEIHPEIHHKVVTLTLNTDVQKYGTNQVKAVCVQRAYESKNGASIAISRSSQSVLKPNNLFKRNIFLEPQEIQNIYYLVVARGRIQKFNKSDEGQYKVNYLAFQITHDMVPDFRVIVFAHHGNELLADSLKIDVEKVCSPEAEVILEAKFDEEEPGSTGKIILHGTRQTSVTLFGIDKTVYAMSRNEILRKEKIFDKLGSHDLGCGPGGGLDTNSVLGNAGVMLVTNKYASSHTDTCREIRRKKRSTVENIVSRYEGKEKICCALGLKIDRHDRICRERRYTAMKELAAIHENCSTIFLECCKDGEEKNVTGTVYFVPGRILGGSSDVVNYLTIDQMDELEDKTTIRKDLKETWFISDYVIGEDNTIEIDISLPHSITTWIIQAVSVSPTHGICVADPKTAVTFKKVFLHINLPYSIKQYEQVNIQATVFNYGSTSLAAYVYMEETSGICASIGRDKKSERKLLHVAAKSSETANFPIVPLSTETFPIKFIVMSSGGGDVVVRKLRVVPRGITIRNDTVIRLDPTNQQRRKSRHVDEKLYTDSIDAAHNLQVTALKLSLPKGTVPGTARCTITAIGDAAGPAVETTLNNPDDLIQLPSGCGEQNMLNLAPTIYTLRYLNYTNKLTSDRKDKALGYIRAGYSNELSFKKPDGSYSIWEDTPSSTWLTAFVMKVFCQGTEFIHLDEKVISSGIQWLIQNQEADGSYSEKYSVSTRSLIGGVQGVETMTAFALISLEECKRNNENLSQAREKARKYLETHMNTVETPLSAAIVAYALALTNSTEKKAANDKLLSMAKKDSSKNYIYWTTSNSAQDIQTAGYGLLTQLALNDMKRSISIVNWLNTKQSKGGQFKSTQDTVIALQSLSEFAIKFPNGNVNLVSILTSSTNKDFRKNFTFNNDNALQAQSVTVPDPDGMIFVQTTGVGVGYLTMHLEYNVPKPEHEICLFNITERISPVENFGPSVGKVEYVLRKPPTRRRRETENASNKTENESEKPVYEINICIRYLGDKDTGMCIADVGLFSGFKPIEDDLKQLENNENDLIQKFEKSSKSIVFYLESVPRTRDFCFSFRIVRHFDIGNTQSSVIKVYDYYDPDTVCTRFYSPGNDSALIRTICTGDYCQCAEGGCPLKTFSDIDQNTDIPADRRDKIKKLLCDEYDYIWLGTLSDRMDKKEGFLLIPFNITEVIKEGTEMESTVENHIRTLRIHEYCETGQILEGSVYLIIGKDPQNREADDEIISDYILDKKSFIHLWVQGKNQFQEDFKVVKDNLNTYGCG